METFSALLALCAGNSPVTKPWCFLWSALNKQLSKQSWGWWFETPSRSLRTSLLWVEQLYCPHLSCVLTLKYFLSFQIWKGHSCVWYVISWLVNIQGCMDFILLSYFSFIYWFSYYLSYDFMTVSGETRLGGGHGDTWNVSYLCFLHAPRQAQGTHGHDVRKFLFFWTWISWRISWIF